MNASPRIVSLIASATEIVCALGRSRQLVGISHECDYPAHVLDRPRLSRTRVDPHATSEVIDRDVRRHVRDGLSIYEIDAAALERLAPDVIVTQDHCAVCAVSLADVEQACRRLTGVATRVVSCEPHRLDDVYGDIRKIGDALDASAVADALIRAMQDALASLAARTADTAPPRVACLEWIDPVMVGGGWLPELVRLAGGEPVIVTAPERFQQTDWDAIDEADPDAVVVMPCGFPVQQSRRELEGEGEAARRLAGLRATREGRTWLVDGNAYFNRPGPRLVESARQLAAILHPDRFPPPLSAEGWTPG